MPLMPLSFARLFAITPLIAIDIDAFRLPPLIFFDFRLRHSPTPPLMLISCI
jgi:hypothetical protein